MRRSRIAATGRALGSERIDNAALARRLGISAEGIEKRTGIRCRYWAGEKEATSDLAIQAAGQALRRAGCSPREIDLIVLSTTSGDYPFPATACLVQSRLGAERAYAYDVNASCTGFLYALSLADHAIRSGRAHRALVIASEVKSRFLNPADPGTAILFGDGAGAVLLEETEAPVNGIDAVFLHADGSQHGLIRLPAGGSRRPLTDRTLAGNEHTIRMQGTALFRVAVRRLIEALDEALVPGWEMGKVDWFVFHQANRRILEKVVKIREIPAERILMTLGDYGNSSSASLPIALDEGAIGPFRRGDRLVLVGFGGGVSWGSARITW